MGQVPWFQHLAFIGEHLVDVNRIVPTVVGPIRIYGAQIFVLTGCLSQPRTARQLLAGLWVDPDFDIVDMAEDFRPGSLPLVDFAGGGHQSPVGVLHATFAALIAVFHVPRYSLRAQVFAWPC